MKAVVDIGSRVEMFVDEWLIEQRNRVEMKMHPPIRREVVLSFDQLWEGRASSFCTIIQEEDKIRLYYRGNASNRKSDDVEQVTCYAESTDGIHFTRPELGIYEFQGSKRNNIVWQGIASHNFAPFRDESPHALPEERYKAVGGVATAGTGPTGNLYGLVSADGIHWRLKQEQPIMREGWFDTHNTVLWDPQAALYRCFSRCWNSSREEKKFRGIETSTSTDFVNWSERQPISFHDLEPLQHYYTNSIILCPEAEHMYLAFPMRLVPQRKKVDEHPYNGISDTVMLTSRDGTGWDRTHLEAWCRAGMDRRNWTDRTGVLARGCAQLGDEEFSFYIQEHYRHDSHRLRRLSVRKHGFGSVHAGYESGEFVTRPILFSGQTLVVNYSTSAIGSLRVELQDEHGRTLEGFAFEDMDPLYGDEVCGLVQWKDGADPGRLNGQPIRMRFQLRDADLYSLQWQ
jgi:hypothetical protein